MTEFAKALIRAAAAMLEHGYHCNASAHQLRGGL
jgi:hypothetical protein